LFKFLLTIGLGIPGDDEDIIENLTKNKILSRETKEKLKAMKGLWKHTGSQVRQDRRQHYI